MISFPIFLIITFWHLYFVPMKREIRKEWLKTIEMTLLPSYFLRLISWSAELNWKLCSLLTCW